MFESLAFYGKCYYWIADYPQPKRFKRALKAATPGKQLFIMTMKILAFEGKESELFSLIVKGEVIMSKYHTNKKSAGKPKTTFDSVYILIG